VQYLGGSTRYPFQTGAFVLPPFFAQVTYLFPVVSIFPVLSPWKSPISKSGVWSFG
jgi:hypothetical protein